MNRLKSIIKSLPFLDRYYFGKKLYLYYRNENHSITKIEFIKRVFKNILIIHAKRNKYDQITKMIRKTDICVVDNESFFYSIDPFKTIKIKNHILDNFSIDYCWVVNSCFDDLPMYNNNSLKDAMLSIINALKEYVDRVGGDKTCAVKYRSNINEIKSLFFRPAEHFHEAIQRILFVNQWLWQSAHKHMGFGHLDWILYDLYKNDVESGYLTKEFAKKCLIDFFEVLHDKCWYKSTMLLGDTGQIVILGGLDTKEHYRCNELTYLFLQVSRDLRLPDPKVLLRVSSKMPDELLRLALECIATGIGAPFLSNDDVVIPSLRQYGYDKDDAYNYGTSACWEPLIIGNSCDQNNIRTINICESFVTFLDSEEFEKCDSMLEIKKKYYVYLQIYLNAFFSKLDEMVFEEDPLLTLFSPEILKTGKDIVRGGAKYANIGVTSVGMSTVVNSLLNIERFVFDEGKYTLSEINNIRKLNYENFREVQAQFNNSCLNFGNDDNKVIILTNEIMQQISETLDHHNTKLGGKYKFGLSSPNYIVDSRKIGATFDGRKAGQPFGVHISGKNGLAPTELICFASKLDYKDNRINGNVVDLILSPYFMKSYLDKTVDFLKSAIKQGFYQLQINVVDSKVLIEAQKHPEKYPELVVRVWGFSAYFKDLPKEYQDNLIRRTIDAEKTA